MLTGVIVAVLFATIATSGDVRFIDGAPSFARDPAVEKPVVQPPVAVASAASTARTRAEVSPIFEVIARVVFSASLALAAGLAAWFLWRHRPKLRLRRPRRRVSADCDVLDDAVAAITADADAQHAALRRGVPRNAIVECWLRLEAAVVGAGVRRNPADTSAELTERVFAASDVDPEAIMRLADLYREARFSDHTMSEDTRREAIDALDLVHAGLRSGRDLVVTTA